MPGKKTRPKRKPPQDRKPVARAADGTVAAGGGSLNPGGQPAWVREFREAFGQRCAPKAEKVLNRILDRALDTEALDDGLEHQDVEVRLVAEKRLSERMMQAGQAADTVLKYVLPKPKQEVEVSAAPGTSAAFAGLSTEQLLELAKAKPKEGP